MKNYLTCFLFSFSSILGVFSQGTFTFLDYNNVNARLSSGGVQFTNEAMGTSSYEVPKNVGAHAIYASSFWFAGVDQNSVLRTSSPKYENQSEIFAGPYSTSSMYADPLYQSKYQSSIWTVTKSEIDYHIQNYLNGSYVLPASIATWPGNGDQSLGVAENLAPFVDVDGDNIYNPIAGDYPDIRGDIATYIIMNDAAAVHTEIGGEPMGIEVHLMAYQYATNDYLNQTTFLNMRVFNRGSYSYSNFKIGMYTDADLGNANDDYFGCLASKNLVYTYNADNNDETDGGTIGYGPNPPCVGIRSLNNNISSAGFYTSTDVYPYNDPVSPMEIWNVLNAKYNDGEDWSSPYQMEGNPYTGSGTTEIGLGNSGGDRRMVMSFNSFPFVQGQSRCDDFAVLYKRGTDNLHSVQSVIELADSVKLFYDSQVDFNCNQVTGGISKLVADQYTIFPNPNNGVFIIRPSEDMAEFEIVVTEPGGRILLNRSCAKNEMVTIELNDYTGICFVTVISEDTLSTQRIVIR